MTWNTCVEKLWTWRWLCSGGENVSPNRKKEGKLDGSKREGRGIEWNNDMHFILCLCTSRSSGTLFLTESQMFYPAHLLLAIFPVRFWGVETFTVISVVKVVTQLCYQDDCIHVHVLLLIHLSYFSFTKTTASLSLGNTFIMLRLTGITLLDK